MQIWIHDSKMKKIVALNNDIPEMLHYSNSAWHPYLEQATSTFDFTIPKFVNGKLHEDIKLITDECFVSFYINGSHQVFYIATLQEDDFNIQLTCNNTNLEYALEYANPFSVDSAQTIEWYLNHMDLLSFAAVELGYNEIPDSKRTLTFDSQETKMARLQSLMSNFDAEFEFKVELNRDGTYKRIVINIYQKADETHHGIGSDRRDVVLYYSNGLKGVQSSSDKTQMFNAGVFTGKDGLSLNDVEISEKNADGIEEFYSRKGNPCLYAPLAMNRYRATMRAEGQDNWIRKDFTTEYENINDLKAYALRTLKQYAYPLMTYIASVQSKFIGNYSDLALGDTVKIIDNNFAGGLALEARVSEMIISFDNPNNNSLVFTNYRRIDNKPTSALQSRIDKAVEDRLPYRIELATTGGVTFKNNEGESVIEPKLYKGNKPFTTDVSWRWALDGVVTVGMQYLVKAKDIDETAVLTVSAYVGNNEVATTEITLTNVNDGPQGPQGDKGEDGRSELRRETFYKLTNSAGVPEAPSEGGRNLLTGTRDWSSNIQRWSNNNGVWNDEPDEYNNLKVKSTTGGWNGWHQNVFVKAGKNYTLSYYAKSDANISVKNSLTWVQSPVFEAPVATFDGNNDINNNITTEWKRYSRTVKITGDGSLQWRIEYNDVKLPSGKWYIAGMKLEERSSASNYTVAPEDLGWSTTTLVPTQTQRYLWKFDYIYYSDGSVKVTSPINISIAGADGKTTYIHFAYADDDKGTNFSLTDNNQQYQGYYSDYTQDDSTDYTKYKWVDRLANVQVGGRNYIRDFGFANNPNFNNNTSSWKYERIADPTARSGYHIKATCIGAGNTGFHRYLIDLRGAEWQGRMMTYSIDIKASKSVRMRLGAEAFNKGYKAFDVTTNWQRFISTDTVNFKTFYSFPFYADTITWAVGDIIYIRDPQLEDGNVATTPIPALEDTQEQIDNKADQTLTQDQLNALAEKNNLIKAEMEAKATIDTVNQWITAYQNYVNANDADKARSEQALKDASERILAIRYEVDNLKVVWDAIDTYMSFQNEGLVIGKKDGSAYAKFSDDRISLFSGSSEVMYISQGTLNIANGIFTKTIQIGRFRFETHPADADMLVVRFVGG